MDDDTTKPIMVSNIIQFPERRSRLRVVADEINKIVRKHFLLEDDIQEAARKKARRRFNKRNCDRQIGNIDG